MNMDSKKNKFVQMMFGLLAVVTMIVLYQNCSEFAASSLTSSMPSAATGPTPSSTETPTLNRTDFMTGLSEPWDLAFTADGNMFFTEKCRGLSIRRPTGAVVRLFGTGGSSLVAADFFCEGQSGMHGVAIDPNFSTNRFVYVYMPSNISNPRSNRVVRLTVDASFASVANRLDIVTDIAFKNAANSWGGAGTHSGGRLRFGPDGLLYVTTGDNHNGTLPQDLTRLGGKVLRINRDGTAAAGNNPPAGADPRIYSYGHRNVQGISFRPGTGQAFVSEHGPGHTDEITPLTAGGNGGWDPKPETGVACADNYCGYSSNKPDGTLTPMTDIAKFPTAMRPVDTNEGRSEGTGPDTFLTGTKWKAWEGRLLVGVMAAQRIDLHQLNPATTEIVNSVTLTLPRARPRSLVQAPDGNLYVATDAGAIWQIIPQ